MDSSTRKRSVVPLPFPHLTTRTLPDSIGRTRVMPASSFESLSSDELSEIMRVALGQPPALPPGCAYLLCGTMGILGAKLGALVSRTKPSLYGQWMDFLTIPRSVREFEALAARLSICRCFAASAPAVLRNSPEDLHLPPHTGVGASAVAEAIIGSIYSSGVLDEYELPWRTHDQLAQSRNWPYHPTDLIPHGPVATIHMLGRWLYIPHNDCCREVCSLNKILLVTFKTKLLPGLLKSPVIWRLASMNLSQAFHDPIQQTSDVEIALDTVDKAGQILQHTFSMMFDDELRMWLGACAKETSYQDIIITCFRAVQRSRDMLNGVPRTAQTSTMSMRMERLQAALWDFAGTVIRITAPGYPRQRTPEHVRSALNDQQTIMKDPVLLLIVNMYDQPWTMRCRGPRCLKTEIDAGRQFKRCSGCKLTPYCSRRCQRAAWTMNKSGSAPSHRATCYVFWRVCVAHNRTGTKKIEPMDIRRELARMVTTQQAQSAINHLEAVHKSQLMSMGAFYFFVEH
jgi:hypothetical protein